MLGSRISSGGMKECSPASRSAKKVSRKYLRPAQKSRSRRLQSREYRKLKQAIPTLAGSPKVDKVEVVREAIMYIDHLHSQILKRFFKGSKFNPEKASSPSAGLVRQLFPSPPARLVQMLQPRYETNGTQTSPLASPAVTPEPPTQRMKGLRS